jgi:hypothetical protein
MTLKDKIKVYLHRRKAVKLEKEGRILAAAVEFQKVIDIRRKYIQRVL